MKIKLHIDREFDGIVVLESSPQMRTLNIEYLNMYVPLPYMIFTIHYEKMLINSVKKFVYSGIYGLGLHVYGKLEPLSSIDDKVFFLPTDYARKGLVCTEHDFDDSNYNSLSELVKKVVNLWFGVGHIMENDDFINWDKYDLNGLKSFYSPDKTTSRQFKKILGKGRSGYGHYGHSDVIEIPENSLLIDKKMVDIDDLEISFPEIIASLCPCTDVMNVPRDAKRHFKDFCWFSRCNDSYANEDKYRIYSHCDSCKKIIPTTAQKEFFFG